jgi:hypothetical protein
MRLIRVRFTMRSMLGVIALLAVLLATGRWCYPRYITRVAYWGGRLGWRVTHFFAWKLNAAISVLELPALLDAGVPHPLDVRTARLPGATDRVADPTRSNPVTAAARR